MCSPTLVRSPTCPPTPIRARQRLSGCSDVNAPVKFRHRIGILVALAAAALVAVTAVTLVLGRHVAPQLAGIETRYVPLVELDRDLKTLFHDQIGRASCRERV